MRKFFCLFLLLFSFQTFSQELTPATDNDAFWKEVFSQMKEFGKVIKKSKEYKLEILFTRIDRNEKDFPAFTLYHFGESKDYFYPASLVKLPMAIFSLEKLRNVYGTAGMDSQLWLDTSSFCNGHHYENFHPVFLRVKEEMTLKEFSSRVNLLPSLVLSWNPQLTAESIIRPSQSVKIVPYNKLLTIRDIVSQMLVFSSNEDYNRLFEWIGRDYVNDMLRELRFENSSLRRRLLFCSDSDQKVNLLFKLISADSIVLNTEPPRMSYSSNEVNYSHPRIGKKHFNGEKMVKGPRDFTGHNIFSLYDLNRMLVKLAFIEYVPEKEKYRLGRMEQRFLLRMMGLYADELDRVRSDEFDGINPGANNFLLLGGKGKLKPNIRVMNVIGQAYGFSSDVAFVVDKDKGVEFFLSARIYTNKNKVIGDDKYQYDKVALPFMKKLGEVILNMESERKKENYPNPNYFMSLFK